MVRLRIEDERAVGSYAKDEMSTIERNLFGRSL
jgi:hypothetical protein